MNQFPNRLLTLVITWTLLWLSPDRACEGSEPPEASEQTAIREMTSAAQQFLSLLDPDQKQLANLPGDDARRMTWFYVPDRSVSEPRTGITLGALADYQRPLALALPATALSHRGNLQATTIMALERVLFEREQNPMRDPMAYYVTIYGTPATDQTWAWSFEGHHLSINVSIVDGKSMSVTPCFMGSNPGTVDDGILGGTKIFDAEERLAFEFIKSLHPSQREAATIPPDDPATTPRGRLEVAARGQSILPRAKFADVGLSSATLDGSQQAMLRRLVDLFQQRFRSEVIADVTPQKMPEEPLKFAWRGGETPHTPHYFRIVSNQFVVEYVNSQNNANHVHALWRKFDGDFARDLLAEHLQNGHGK